MRILNQRFTNEYLVDNISNEPESTHALWYYQIRKRKTRRIPCGVMANVLDYNSVENEFNFQSR